MSEDFSRLLEEQISGLQEEMGIDSSAPQNDDVKKEVVEEVKPKTSVSKGKPGRNFKKLVEKRDTTIASSDVKKQESKDTSHVYRDLFNGMVDEVEKPIVENVEVVRKGMPNLKENVEVQKVQPYKKPVSIEELSKSMHDRYNSQVKEFTSQSSMSMSPATVKALSDNISFVNKDETVKKEEFFMDNGMVITEKLKNLQMQMNVLNTSFSALQEGTMVSGIGQGGDGQLPGSGEVQLKYMDDVSILNIQPGDTLIWDDSNGGGFVPGAGGGGGAGGAVDRLVSGLGIDITPPGGIGIVQIDLDASIQDLNDVSTGATPINGDLLVYNGNTWDVGSMNTSQLALNNPTTLRGNYLRITPGSYTTQEDANILFVNEIDDLVGRMNHIEGTTKPGLFLGLLDCTVADNEPDDKDSLNAGDYFIHDGATGPLWGVGETIEDKHSVVWTGTQWEVLTSSNTLAQLGDVTLSVPLNDHILVYDETNSYWYNKEPDFPKVTVGTAQPNDGSEKDGDIYYDTNTSELYIYNTIWEKVSGGGGSVKIAANAPDPANEGDLWVETDNWTILVYDGFNWVGLTNSGLINGQDPSSYVTNTDLNATIDSLEFQINRNAQSDQASLIAAVQALDLTHLRMEPQGPLTGPLTLSDDAITTEKQATTKEFVDSNFLNLNPQAPLTGTLTLESDILFNGDQNKIISVNNAKTLKIRAADAAGNNRTFIDIQNNDNYGGDGDDDGYRIKIYHVADPTSAHHVANKKYVDEQAGSSVPVGSIMMWINATAPTGWFKLKGSSFDINAFPLLHAYLQLSSGYTSGKLPDWRGKYPGQLGDHMTGDLGSFHSQRTAKPSGGYPKSSHQFNDGSVDTANKAGGTNYADNVKQQVTIDTGWDSVTRPPSVAVHFIIKHD